jgi:signal transduction histidine kinase/CheY-like chemotaxis protein
MDMTDGRYLFPPDRREAYEVLQAPLGVYQYVGGKVVTLLVSDGLCAFQGESRDVLTRHFDDRMFEKVHPDDVQMLAQMAYKFAIQVGKYDVVYRSRLYGQEGYRYVHAVSKYHTMEDGSQIAFTHYADITEGVQSLVDIAQNVESPLATFLNEYASAMVIVESKTKHLFYYNKAVCRMLAPQVVFDSGMTFQQFFYDDIPEAIAGLFTAVDMGLHIVVEPRTQRQLEVMVISTTWAGEEAYAVYFYEYQPMGQAAGSRSDIRHKRIAFQNVIFSGTGNDLNFWQDGYKAVRVWNLTKDKLVMDEGRNFLKGRYGDGLTYSLYHRDVLEKVPRQDERDILEQMAADKLVYLYETGEYPRTVCFRLETSYGHVDMQTGFVLMRSPDDGDLYLKLTEENISQQVITGLLFRRALEKEYDYVAYFDGKGNTCRIISSKVTSEDQRDRLISIEDYLLNFREHLGSAIWTPQDFIRLVYERCCRTAEYVFTYELPNGDIKRVHIQLLDRDNQLFIIHRSDVTKLLQVERRRQMEIEVLKDEAQAANREKSMFIARMSHDLRTPMGAILSLAQFGQEECREDTCRAYFQQISESGHYMLGMLKDILDMQKLASGDIELLEDTIQAGDIEKHVFTIVKQRAQQKQLHFSTEHIFPTNQYLCCDSRRVERILINVLNNAIKYTPEGGSVTWKSHLETREGKPFVVHEIADTGVGMSAEFMEHLFEAFSQEMNRLSRQEGGTGLGLAIVKKLVDAMHGSIEVQSELGKGSCFTIVIPCGVATEAQITVYHEANQPSEVKNYDFSGCRILVCEDNELNQMIITKILETVGGTVQLANNGQEGCQLAEKYPYDVILMDVRMPVMDGLEAAREIRKFNRTIPIVALSANAYAEDVQKSLAAGMDEHLSKPINTQELFAVLRRFLQGKGRTS